MSYFIDQRTLEEIRDRADIVDIVGEYVNLQKRGANFMGLCPFHNEKTPSFSVSPNKNFFHCFGCGAGGDVITFIMRMEGLSFPEAAKKLADRYQISIQGGYKVDDSLQKEREEAYKINRTAALFFRENLKNSKYAINYLLKRGININAINRFGIGYAPDEWDSLIKHLNSHKLSIEIAEKIGLINKRKNSEGYYDTFRNRIIFPIIDYKKRVIGFGARVLDDSMPKYLNSYDSFIFNKGNNIYGINYQSRTKKADRLIVTEGYMDVIALYMGGIDYAVASLGTALTRNQVKLLKRYSDNFLISYDGDEAGLKATEKAIGTFKLENINPKIIRLPEGLDPDDFIKKYGKMQYESMVNKAEDSLEFLISNYKKDLDPKNIDDNIKLIKYIANLLKGIKSPIERDIYINKLAKEYSISPHSIKSEIMGNNDWLNKDENLKSISSNKDEKNSLNRKSFKYKIIDVFRLMLEDRIYYEKINAKLKPEIFSNSVFEELYRSIREIYQESETVDKLAFLNYLKENFIIDETLYNELLKPTDEYHESDLDAVINDFITNFEKKSLQKDRKEILKRISYLENKELTETEREELISLINKLMILNKSLDQMI
ncbi:MAG: DNA primase [Tissierellia bacterium]|nr:DNA primase [Tissierellia bacterium]